MLEYIFYSKEEGVEYCSYYGVLVGIVWKFFKNLDSHFDKTFFFFFPFPSSNIFKHGQTRSNLSISRADKL